MFKRKPYSLAILIVTLLAAAITIVAVFRLDLLFTGRGGYLEYAAYETQTGLQPSPQIIALDLAKNWCDSPDVCLLEEVRVFRVAANRAIIIIQTSNLRGDSVDGSQVRIELLRVEAAWNVEWAGTRWRCRSFRSDNPGWTVETCP